MAITYGFRESYSESYSEETNEVRAELQTDWSDVAVFPEFALGNVTTVAGSNLQRTLPLRHPTKSHLYIAELGIKRCVGAFRPHSRTGLIEFFDNQFDESETHDGKCQWDAVYRPRPYSVLDDTDITTELERWVIKESDRNLEAMSLPGNMFKFESNGGPIPEGIALQRQVELHQYTWVMVPETVVQTLRTGAWLSVAGCVNQAEFDGMPAGSALCMAPKKSTLKYTVTGIACRDVIYTFAQRYGNTWNQAYNPSRKVGGALNPGFDNVVPRAPNVNTPFLSADFAALFQAA